MSGFSFNPSAPAESETPEPSITNDGWFPDVNPVTLRKAIRLRDGVTAERLREAVLGAMLTVNGDLTAWQLANVAGGFDSLGAVPSTQLGGESRLVTLYRRALLCAVKAEMVERYRDVDLTGAGQRQVGDLDQSVEELRRDMAHAIRDMLGRGRTTVELM